MQEPSIFDEEEPIRE